MLTFIPRGKRKALQQIQHLGEIAVAINREAQNREKEFYYRDAYTVSSCMIYLRLLAQANMVWHGIAPRDATNAFLSRANPAVIARAEASYEERHQNPFPPCHDMRGVLGVTGTEEGGPACTTPETKNAPRSVLVERAAQVYVFQRGLSDLDETYNFPYMEELIGYAEEHINFILKEGKISRYEMEDAYHEIRDHVPFGSYDDFDCVLRSEIKAMEKYGPIFWSESMQKMGFGRVKGVIVPVGDARSKELLEALAGALQGAPDESS